MQTIKRTYVDFMQHLGGLGPLARVGEKVDRQEPHTPMRWFASLFAIYETDRMIALDLPWWNVAATRQIEAFLAGKPDARVFEYGSGASTVWLARRAGEVVTVEHDQAWLTKFQRQTAGHENVTLLYREIESGPAAYCSAIDEMDGDFDVVVIDGRHRAECLHRAAPRLKQDGIIIFDDSGRSRYRSAIQSSGLHEQRHFGLSYCVPYPDHTSILTHGLP